MPPYSKGPWRNNTYRVCSGVGTSSIKVICDTAHNSATRTAENLANARLIASAPELLEAAMDAVSKIEDCAAGKINFRDDFADRLRAAISKAISGE